MIFTDRTMDRIESGAWEFLTSGTGSRFLCLENACSEEYLRVACGHIEPDVDRWKRFGGGKLQFSALAKLPPSVQAIFEELHSERMVNSLRALSGIADLTPDLSMLGGGIHATPRGGRLGVHVDFNRHRDGRYRRLNLFLFLGNGKDWLDDWGGALELWDPKGTRCVCRLYPMFNRLVIFEATESSWHGHPHPCQCPDGAFRLSLACYYYSESAPPDYRGKHSTIYR